MFPSSASFGLSCQSSPAFRRRTIVPDDSELLGNCPATFRKPDLDLRQTFRIGGDSVKQPRTVAATSGCTSWGCIHTRTLVQYWLPVELRASAMPPSKHARKICVDQTRASCGLVNILPNVEGGVSTDTLARSTTGSRPSRYLGASNARVRLDTIPRSSWISSFRRTDDPLELNAVHHERVPDPTGPGILDLKDGSQE